MDKYIKKNYIENIFVFALTIFMCNYLIDYLFNIIFGNPYFAINDWMRMTFDLLTIIVSTVVLTFIFSFICGYKKKVIDSEKIKVETILEKLKVNGYTLNKINNFNLLYKYPFQKFYFGSVFVFTDKDNIVIYAAKPVLNKITCILE